MLKHKGSGFEYDQVADPSPIVGSDGGEARLYYDGDNNVVGQCSIGMATARAVPREARAHDPDERASFL